MIDMTKVQPQFGVAAAVVMVLQLAVGAADAAVVVDDSIAFATGAGIIRQGDYTLSAATDLSGFDPSGSDKLVVTISGERGGAVSNPIITSVTYGGVAMTEAIQAIDPLDSQRTGIFFLDNPTAAGDLFIDVSSRLNGVGVSLLALSGTEPGVALTNGSDGQSTSLTTLVDDTFLVASHVNNGNGATAQPPLTPLLNDAVGSAGGGSGFQNVPTAGLVTPTFTDNTIRPVTVAAAFEPAGVIPEPGSVAIWSGLGLFLAGFRSSPVRSKKSH